MTLAEIVNDVKAHFEHGRDLLESHLPGLMELAGKIEADPLVQAAIGLAVPDSTRVMLAELLKSVEAETKQVAAQAVADEQQRAAAEAAPVPDSAEVAA